MDSKTMNWEGITSTFIAEPQPKEKANNNLFSGPSQLYQPAFSALQKGQPEERDFQIDPVALHNVELLKYFHKMTDELQKKEPFISMEINPPPKIDIPIEKKSFLQFKPNIIGSDFLHGNLSDGRVSMQGGLLTPECKKSLLQKSVATISINSGFTSCTQSTMDTMTGLLHQFLSTMVTRLSSASTSISSNHIGGSNQKEKHLLLLLKIFADSGIGSATDLLSFHKTNVVDYNRRLIKQCDAVYKDCLLKQEKLKLKEQASISEIVEKLSDESSAIKSQESDSKKRNFDAMNDDGLMIGFYGHTEALLPNQSPSVGNSAKKMKM